MQKWPLGTYCMPIVVFTAEDQLQSSQIMELDAFKNCNHIVRIWLLQINVDMTGLSSRLHIKEGGLPSTTSKGFRMWLQFLNAYDGIKCIQKLQSHCANMTFADKSRYDRTFQQVTHKGGESAINYISKIADDSI